MDQADEDSLRSTLRELMHARARSLNLTRILHCTRSTSTINGVRDVPMISSISRFPRDERNLIINWLAKSGPFIDDDRTEVDDDLYYLGDHEVTELAAGEAARQRQKDKDGRLLSLNGNSNFNKSPLDVLHGLQEEPFGMVPVPNTWCVDEAIAWADSADPEPKSWRELLDVSRRRFGALLISEYCEHVLRGQTFYPAVARRVLELLKILNEISASSDQNSKLSKFGTELVNAYFVGDKAWFTDESDGNKADFAGEMTFPDPGETGSAIQCFWHGKVKTPQFRVHFEWPMPAKSQRIKVVYIGPKISKR